jgi:hypothetical protein
MLQMASAYIALVVPIQYSALHELFWHAPMLAVKYRELNDNYTSINPPMAIA